MKKTLTKRKMYQKRRKKEKEEKRRNQKQQTLINGATAARMTANIKHSNKKHNQQPRNMNMTSTTTDAKGFSQRVSNNQHIPYLHYSNPFNSYTEGMRQWWQTYCTALQYHNEQGKQWKATYPSGESSTETRTELLEKYAEEYETSSEEDDEEEPYLEPTEHVNCDQQPLVHHEEEQEDIDLEYLKFLEITHKHREELKLTRAAENIC